MRNEIVVSIICTAYNHEKYIRKTLDGFVNQKTNFAYEVLINDDASTDKTANIIREYQVKYPDIIKPIYQTENQYSKGVTIVKNLLVPKALGKYLAFCEGDDYWCSEDKLQLQIDYLESHPQCPACVHNTLFVDVINGKSKNGYIENECDLELKDCVMSGGQSFHTSSLIVKKEIYLNKPVFTTLINGVGDYPNSIYYALCGKIHYFGKVMSVYNINTQYSWTVNVGKNSEKMIKLINDAIIMLETANEYSNYKYDALFQEAIRKKRYTLLCLEKKYKEMYRNKEFYNRYNLKGRIYIFLLAYFPFVSKPIEFYRKLKK